MELSSSLLSTCQYHRSSSVCMSIDKQCVHFLKKISPLLTCWLRHTRYLVPQTTVDNGCPASTKL